MTSPKSTAAPGATGRTIFILDTHVLYQYLKGQCDFGNALSGPDEGLRDRILALLNTQSVVIPHVCLVEIIGQFFHTNIDLDNYDQWYRLRRVAFNPILNTLFDTTGRIVLRTERPRIQALNHAHLPVSKQLRDQLVRHYQNRKEKTLRAREPKVLDGMDAQILDDAVCVALENPVCRCELVSRDMPLKFAVDDVRRRAATDLRLPKNLFFRSTYSLPRLSRHWSWNRSQPQ